MKIYRCEHCALLFAHPLPSSEQLTEFYQGFLYRRPDHRAIPRLKAERRDEITRVFGLSPGAKTNGRTFLDHGGGTGLAYAAAKELGLDSWFSEMDEQAVAFVREQFGLPVSRRVEDIARHAGQFDYALSDNVVEHVPDPAALLSALVASLKPGGTLIMKTPHAAANDNYFYPRILALYAKKAARHNGWAAALKMLAREPIWFCDPPRHLYSFSKGSLHELARSIGLQQAEYRVETYESPLLRNSFYERTFRRPRSLKGLARQAVGVPIVSAELTLKLAQAALRRAGQISPAGLILRVQRAQPRSSV
jgi:2-polyprenyl-3-methyl-5-hydroxy-6-metoxy-1,4-benzoquinol methylase